MRELHILLPMGGLGSRFADKGFEDPKPLIPVDGVPMFAKALSSLADWEVKTVHTAVIRREHEERFGLGSRIQESCPGCEVVLLEELTRGAVETCLAAAPKMSGDRGLLVLDCDLWFHSPAYGALVRRALSGEPVDGGVLTFRSQLPRYSYAALSGDQVRHTAEKVVISEHALAGAWFFGTERSFVGLGKRLLEREPTAATPEYYLSLLYNIAIDDGARILAAPVSDYASFGTPEELAAYEGRSQPGSPAS